MIHLQRALGTICIVLLALTTLGGCSSDTGSNADDTCGAPGGVQDCLCPDTTTSVQSCQDDGTWGACACGTADPDVGRADVDLEFDTGDDADSDTGDDADAGETPDTGTDTDDDGTDTDDADTDTGDTGVDTDDAGSDTHDIGVDTDDAGADTSDVGVDTDDAGTDASDAGPDTTDVGTDVVDTGTDTALAGPGEPCVGNAECASDVCLNLGDGSSACTEACDGACTLEGWTCFEDLCVPDDWCVDAGGVPVGPGCPTDCGDACDPDATCSVATGTPTCVCNAGFEGDGASCTDVDECAAGTDDCDENAICANTDGGFTCTCDDGWEGDGRTCTDINECALGIDDCDPNATCNNRQGFFRCTCDEGFTGGGRTCTDIDECAEGLDDCDTNATCNNTDGEFTCACDDGWEGDGRTCTDINECALGTDDCDANATCTNRQGSFRCSCDSGWEGDGRTCIDVDECARGLDDCDANATCSDTDGSFRCTCDPGWAGNGRTCLDVNECVLGTDDCDEQATCSNIGGSFRCACDDGWQGDGRTCTDVNECIRGTDECDVNATCQNLVGTYTCSCDDGFFGDGFECFSASTCPDGTPDAGVCDGNTLRFCDDGTTVSTDCDTAWAGIGGECGEYTSGGLTCVVPSGDACVADLGDGNVLLPCEGATPSCEFIDGAGYVCGDGDRGSCTAADEGGCIGDLLVQACIGSSRVPYGIECGSLGATCNDGAGICAGAPEGSLCVTGLIECGVGLRCEGESPVSNGVCTPLPSGGEISCEPVTGFSATIDYEIAADTTSYMIVPFADDGTAVTPLSIDLPGGGEIDFFGANSFQLATAGLFGFINPIVVPGTPDFGSQLRAGSHRMFISTNADEVCWFLLEERSPGTTIDLNIYLVGVPGTNASNAAAGDLGDVIDELDVVLANADLSVGTVRWFDASPATTTAYRIIRDSDDAAELVATSTDPGATLSDRLSLNVFLTEAFVWFDGSGVIGISNGLPGAAALHGTRASGVVFTTEYIDGSAFGAEFTAQVMAHEIGHFLGLFHTTEQDQVTHDPLDDTPECTSGPLESCPDANNLMFPFAGTANTQISDDQSAVLGANPFTRD